MLAFALALVAAADPAVRSDAPASGLRPSQAEPAPPRIPFEKYQLPNGLTVILSEDHRAPVVGVDVWYHVGAANEARGKSGFAHLFEHLMFQGTKHVTGDERAFFNHLERNGATNLNATTEFDRTNYFETMPSDRVEIALWLESDRMGFLLDAVDQKKLDTQREVVRNERRQSIENAPYQKAEVRLVELLFPSPHPYFGAVIGSHQDLQAARLEDVRAFFRTYYAPNNASLALVGDFDPATVKPLVEKWFGPIPRGPEPPRLENSVLVRAARRKEKLTDQVQLAKVVFGWVGPRPTEDEPLQVAMRILGSGKSSRLYQALVHDRRVAQDVSASSTPAQLGGETEIEATVQVGHTPDEVEKALAEEIALLRDAPPSEEELLRAQRNLIANIYAALENVGGSGGKADLLNYFEMWRRDPGFLTEQIARAQAVTAADVQKAAKRWLADDSRVTLHIVPEQGAAR
ncbi:MAG: M16 family metallopeptidase [Myxococcales bacterium]